MALMPVEDRGSPDASEDYNNHRTQLASLIRVRYWLCISTFWDAWKSGLLEQSCRVVLKSHTENTKPVHCSYLLDGKAHDLPLDRSD